MPGTPLDSSIYRDLLGDREIGHLFSDGAEIRAMLLVEGALAQAQGAVGLIPEVSASAIRRASLEVQIDPHALCAATGRNAVPVPALIAAFREAMQAPEHAQYIHWGATSQDIMDTALMLRLRQALTLIENRISETLTTLADLAEEHAETPMVARTYGQAAVPSSFGAMVAGWGFPLLDHRAGVDRLRDSALTVSLSGAAGNLSAMGAQGPQIRAGLAQALDLGDPGRSWHSDRSRVLRVANWLSAVSVTLGKMGEDLILLTQSGIDEVRLDTTGGSSTMPQKNNPVAPSVLVALARQATGLNAILTGAGLHRQARDGAAWITEWLSLPQLCIITGRAALTAQELVRGLIPDADAMALSLTGSNGSVFAETLSFALAENQPRAKAQAEVQRLATDARETGRTLEVVAREAYPGLAADLFHAESNLGSAPADARAFSSAVRAGVSPK